MNMTSLHTTKYHFPNRDVRLSLSQERHTNLKARLSDEKTFQNLGESRQLLSPIYIALPPPHQPRVSDCKSDNSINGRELSTYKKHTKYLAYKKYSLYLQANITA